MNSLSDAKRRMTGRKALSSLVMKHWSTFPGDAVAGYLNGEPPENPFTFLAISA